jgi:hypothetical protein
MIRTTLPALTGFFFKGISEYAEDFMARIDAPLLHDIHISFFNQLIFNIPQLLYLINCIERFKGLNAKVLFLKDNTSMELSSEMDDHLLLGFSCNQADWQLSLVAQLCSTSLHPISALENLKVMVDSDNPQHFGQFDIDHNQWMELLLPFTNVKNIFLAEDVALHVITTLQGFCGEEVTQVLPTLRSLLIKGLQPSGLTQEAVESFVAAYQCFGHSVAIHHWEEGSDMEYSPDESEQELDSEWESDKVDD